MHRSLWDKCIAVSLVGGPATGDRDGRREQIVGCRRHCQQADSTRDLRFKGRQRKVEVDPPSDMHDVRHFPTNLWEVLSRTPARLYND